eukprot:TRINITY_DN75837_c0_g1_i1.p1 TRINITY_DN75837_c0_g1~~TRINITY_DN75837_c0_g1_i1.p1  ORF type:complete len:239 (-),score=29.72 TRINITY_DN75837_c0_g1_i1:118-834(-)
MDSFGESASVDDSRVGGGLGADEPFVNKDVTRLFSCWRNEKYAPELLPFDREVIENIAELLQYVSETMDEERMDEDFTDPNDPDYVLRSMDLQRTRYVLRDLLRIRLWKLGKWPQHYLEPSNMALLSDAERLYLRDAWDLKAGFLEHRLLGALPEAKRGLNDTIDLYEMVRRPVLDNHVYVRITGDVGTIEIPPSMTQDSAGTQRPLNLEEGNTYLLRYSLIRKFLMEPEHMGKVQLV